MAVIYNLFYQEQNVIYVWDSQDFLSNVLLVIRCLKLVFLGSIVMKEGK